MSTRGGDNKKKGQKHQNTFAFKHNRNSMLTRKIMESPLDHLCKRCLDKLEWRMTYRKYKPLTTPAICLFCEMRTVYKAYRRICDSCSEGKKSCAKCCEPIEEYAKPSHRRNDPLFKNRKDNPLADIMKDFKLRHKKTIERKFNDGHTLAFDKEKGVFNEKTGEVYIDIKALGAIGDDSDDEDSDKEEIVDTNKKPGDISEEDKYEDDSDE